MDTLTKYLAVAAGGALGAMLRYYLGGSVLSRTAAPFPTATFVINVTGSFLIGFFLTLAAERVNISPHMKLAFAVALGLVFLAVGSNLTATEITLRAVIAIVAMGAMSPSML